MKKNYFSQLSALSETQGELTEKSDATWYSKSVPCRTACPANTDIPSYLEAIYQGDYEKAYNINLFLKYLGAFAQDHAKMHADTLAIIMANR